MKCSWFRDGLRIGTGGLIRETEDCFEQGERAEGVVAVIELGLLDRLAHIGQSREVGDGVRLDLVQRQFEIVPHAHPLALRDVANSRILAGGLFHSTDSGASFTKVGSMDGTVLVGLGSAAPGASYPALYVVGTVGSVYGFFRSDDAGVTWTRINDDNHQFGGINVIIGDPRIYGRVYLGANGRGILYGDIAR